MARGLDHIVHAVADLDGAAEFYRRCGFQVGARNRHPWGTHNHVVQLPGFFIEILTVAEPEKLGDDGLSRHFGIPNREAIARCDGFSMLVLESADSAADVAEFKRAGIGISESLPFSRQATLPDGSTAKVGFVLAFAHDAKAPRTLFSTCEQANPEAFWSTAYQKHANGAQSVMGVVLLSSQPSAHDDFLKQFGGVEASESRVAGLLLRTPRGEIEVVEPKTFGDRYGIVPKAGEGAEIAGLRVAVESLEDLERRLRGENLPTYRSGAHLAVPPQAAFGATLIFEQAALS